MHCENCKHWQRLHGEQGECRHNPPIGILMTVQNKLSNEAIQTPGGYWPPVRGDSWCGQHEMKLSIHDSP